MATYIRKRRLQYALLVTVSISFLAALTTTSCYEIDNSCSYICSHSEHNPSTHETHNDCKCSTSVKGMDSEQERSRREDEFTEEPNDELVPTPVPTMVEGNGNNDGVDAPTPTDTISPRPNPSSSFQQPISPQPSIQPQTVPPTPIAGEGNTSPKPTIAPSHENNSEVVVPSFSPKPTISPRPNNQSNNMMPSVSPKPFTFAPILETPPVTTPPITTTNNPTPMYITDTNQPTVPRYDYEPPSTMIPNGNNNNNNEAEEEQSSITSTANNNSNNNNNGLSGGGKFGIILVVGLVIVAIGTLYVTVQRRLRKAYHGSYATPMSNGMNHRETELGLWRAGRHNDDDDGLL